MKTLSTISTVLIFLSQRKCFVRDAETLPVRMLSCFRYLAGSKLKKEQQAVVTSPYVNTGVGDGRKVW